MDDEALILIKVFLYNMSMGLLVTVKSYVVHFVIYIHPALLMTHLMTHFRPWALMIGVKLNIGGVQLY